MIRLVSILALPVWKATTFPPERKQVDQCAVLPRVHLKSLAITVDAPSSPRRADGGYQNFTDVTAPNTASVGVCEPKKHTRWFFPLLISVRVQTRKLHLKTKMFMRHFKKRHPNLRTTVFVSECFFFFFLSVSHAKNADHELQIEHPPSPSENMYGGVPPETERKV